jgi:tetratricopeptide (TPR) repeat protein
VRTKGRNGTRQRGPEARGSHLKRAFVACGVATLGAALLAACGATSATVVANEKLVAGIAAQRAGDYVNAAADYTKILKSEPKNIYALYDLGDVEQFQNQVSAAMHRYSQVLAIDPRFENALYNMAILESQSKPAAAKALFLQVVTESPSDAVARLNLGKVLLALGETKQANAQIAQAIRLEPSLKSVKIAAS